MACVSVQKLCDWIYGLQFFQEQILVVSDIDALYHIVVKHVEIFDTVDWFIEYVLLVSSLAS